MKPIQLNKFRPQTRNIAELMWGRGGTCTHRTNRVGAYYHSCAGHGGYLVLETALTEEEIAKVKPFATREYINILVQKQDKGDFVVGVDNTPMNRGFSRAKSFHADLRLGSVEWQKFYIYVFEEDCAWSIIEKFTDIRLKRGLTQASAEFYEARENQIEKTFNKYYANKN